MNETGNVCDVKLNLEQKMVSMPDIEPSSDQASESMFPAHEEPKSRLQKKKESMGLEDLGYLLPKSNSDIPHLNLKPHTYFSNNEVRSAENNPFANDDC